MTTETRTSSPEELEAAFRRESAENRWAAAETAYALAVLHDRRGDRPAALHWASASISLLDSLPSETEQQVATARTDVGGVPLPSYLHAGLVRSRFAELA